MKVCKLTSSISVFQNIFFEGEIENANSPEIVDFEVETTTLNDCSVNCGIGNKTTIKVICNGKKLETGTASGSKKVNLQIDSAAQCHTEISYTPCKGTDQNCPG